jgi:hypothetical protein
VRHFWLQSICNCSCLLECSNVHIHVFWNVKMRGLNYSLTSQEPIALGRQYHVREHLNLCVLANDITLRNSELSRTQFLYELHFQVQLWTNCNNWTYFTKNQITL